MSRSIHTTAKTVRKLGYRRRDVTCDDPLILDLAKKKRIKRFAGKGVPEREIDAREATIRAAAAKASRRRG